MTQKILASNAAAQAKGFLPSCICAKVGAAETHRECKLQYHLTDGQVGALVQGSKHPNLLNNPVTITEDMLREMYGKLR